MFSSSKSIISMSPCQLSQIAQGSRICITSVPFTEISVPLVPSSRLGVYCNYVTVDDILVDSDGRAHIGGLGTAFVLSTTSAVDIDRVFHNAFLEVANPQ
ncbi:hypothetical protein BDM02DRAFT_2861707 [Thelephora ganbajun]|uniref:Uncharacterized protein n=1 Tax=Thelephora ganbajun TaxID=370292 RepID=A0ACB6ZC79_THEGA|nr:hypothetical protein BDM02DRAFT_2861707 [Thelephora ganbajun]